MTFLHFQVAIAYHNLRKMDLAVEYFKDLLGKDPFRLDNLDTYSNLLYVKEQRVELAHLAHKSVMMLTYIDYRFGHLNCLHSRLRSTSTARRRAA